MKTWWIVTGLVVATALAGHFFGRWQGQREVLAERQREAAALVAKQRAIGESIARHVRASDEIVVVTFVSVNPRETRQAFRDDAWREKLAGLLLEAPYRPTGHGLWMTSRHLQFTEKGATRLTCIWLGDVLRVYGDGITHGNDSSHGGDFVAGDAVTEELSAWVNAKTEASGGAKAD